MQYLIAKIWNIDKSIIFLITDCFGKDFNFDYIYAKHCKTDKNNNNNNKKKKRRRMEACPIAESQNFNWLQPQKRTPTTQFQIHCDWRKMHSNNLKLCLLLQIFRKRLRQQFFLYIYIFFFALVLIVNRNLIFRSAQRSVYFILFYLIFLYLTFSPFHLKNFFSFYDSIQNI